MGAYMLAVAPGVVVPVFIDGGFVRNVEQSEDVDRAINGALLITQTSSTPAGYKETLNCRTPPLTVAAATAVVNALRAAALLGVASDTDTSDVTQTPFRNGVGIVAHPVIRSFTPVTTPGTPTPTRRYVVTFDLVEA